MFRNTFTFWFSTPTRFSWKICSLLKDGLLTYFFSFLSSVNNCILQRCLGDSRDLPYMLQKKKNKDISLSLMCAYYGVAVVVFVINIFFYFIRINVSEHVENKSNCSTIMKISYLLHISLKKSFSKSFLAFFLILELKSM